MRSQPMPMTKKKEEKDGRKREGWRDQHIWGGELGDIHEGIISCVIRTASRAAVPEVVAPQIGRYSQN